MGFEPTTSSMPSRRAPNCATAPLEELPKVYHNLSAVFFPGARYSPTSGEQSLRGRQAAFLVTVVSGGGTLADRFGRFITEPAIECSLERVGFRGHKTRGPQKRLASRGLQVGAEESLAGASEDDELPTASSLPSLHARNLKIHEGIVSYVDHQVCLPGNR